MKADAENRKEIILKNSAVGLFSKVVAMIMQFFVQITMLHYIGIEIMGISSTITSTLSTLALTELGFQTAVVYYLYIPLREQNNGRINQILEILRRVYIFIGCIFIILSLITIPGLKYILKGVDITEEVIAYYLLMSLNNACSYFVAYKRALLFASQKEYVSKLVDSIFNVIFNVLSIIGVVLLKSYTLVLLLQIVQTIGSNFLIHKYCKIKYPYLVRCKFNKNIFNKILLDVKNVFLGKFAGYVYGATDNLVISTCIGTVNVGYLTNYTIFTSAIKSIVSSIFNGMTPIIGNMLINSSETNNKEIDFRMYCYVRYLATSVIIIPWIIFADDIIKLFYGEQYILSIVIVILLASDMYIHLVYTSCVEYINASGKFAIDKNIGIIGALLNIIVSIWGVFRWGIEGVLIGTLISQIFFWIGRSAVVYFKVFEMKVWNWGNYIIKNILWLFVAIITILCMWYIKKILYFFNTTVTVVILLGLCEGINFLLQFTLLHNTKEQVQFIKMLIKKEKK